MYMPLDAQVAAGPQHNFARGADRKRFTNMARLNEPAAIPEPIRTKEMPVKGHKAIAQRYQTGIEVVIHARGADERQKSWTMVIQWNVIGGAIHHVKPEVVLRERLGKFSRWYSGMKMDSVGLRLKGDIIRE